MRVEPAPTPAMLAVHFPPRHSLQIFQPQVCSRACRPAPWTPVRPGTLNKSRLCGAEELTCGASMSNFRQSPASSCLPTLHGSSLSTWPRPRCTAFMNIAPRWCVVTQTPFQSPICQPYCCAARRGHGSMHAYGRAARRRPFSDHLWGRAPNLARSDLQGNQDPGKPNMHGNGRPSSVSLRPA